MLRAEVDGLGYGDTNEARFEYLTRTEKPDILRQKNEMVADRD